MHVPSRRTWLKRAAVGLGILAFLVGVRAALEPRRMKAPPAELSAEDRATVAASLQASSRSRGELLRMLAPRRVLLIGESHFYAEPQRFAEELVSDLHSRDGRKAVLLLELPSGMQAELDRHLQTGEEAALERAWRSHTDALPYQGLVRWARAHPELVRGVVADDEPSWHVGAMRLLLTDTRNETMAEAIAGAARANPDDRIVAFGGCLHMMKAGRYMFDSPSRSPVGARLRTHGFGADELASIWLFTGEAAAEGTWSEPGAISFAASAGQLPIPLFERDAVFGASRMEEIADAAVFLGPATRIAGL